QSSFEYLGEGNEVPFGERDHDSDRRGGRGSRRFFWKEYDRSFHFWPRSRLGSSFGPLSRNASGTFLPSRRTRTFQKCRRRLDSFDRRSFFGSLFDAFPRDSFRFPSLWPSRLWSPRERGFHGRRTLTNLPSSLDSTRSPFGRGRRKHSSFETRSVAGTVRRGNREIRHRSGSGRKIRSFVDRGRT